MRNATSDGLRSVPRLLEDAILLVFFAVGLILTAAWIVLLIAIAEAI